MGVIFAFKIVSDEETEDKAAAEDDRKLMPPPSWLPTSSTQPISVVTSESWSSSGNVYQELNILSSPF